MDRQEAARLLGVSPTSPADEIRRAYRSLIRVHHPDQAGASPAATAKASGIIEAYRVLQSPAPPRVDTRPPPPSRPPPPPPSTSASARAARTPWAAGRITLVDADTLALDATAEDTFLLLLDAAHEMGDVTYVDPDVGLLEARVQFEGTPMCSLVISLQGRNNRTDAFCTIESLDHRPPPDIADVVALLATIIRSRLQP